MSMPTDIGVIDLMTNIPGEHTDKWYGFTRRLLLDQVWPQFLRDNAVRVFKL